MTPRVSDRPSLAEIFASVQDDLAAVQDELRRQLVPPAGVMHAFLQRAQRSGHMAGDATPDDASLLAKVSAHLAAGQGKGLRPALVMLASRLGTRPSRQTLVPLAAAIELMHHATLVHDDIIDAAPVRRKQPSLNAVWGNEISVIAGDFLYARAFALAAGFLGTTEMQTLARVADIMCQGELAEIEHRFDTDLAEAGYLHIIQQKTAILISACCELGARLAGAPDDAADRMAEFGMAFGLAFQIADDCLDLIGNEAALGKSTCTDLAHGSLSLPFIYLAASYSSSERRELFEPCFHEGAQQEAAIARLVRQAQQAGAIERAYQTAHAWAKRAQAAVEPLNGCALKSQYLSLAEYAVERQA